MGNSMLCFVYIVLRHVVHVGQDGHHACGARRSPCMWGKTVPMHVGQDSSYVSYRTYILHMINYV